jgi:hypothetical protein
MKPWIYLEYKFINLFLNRYKVMIKHSSVVLYIFTELRKHRRRFVLYLSVKCLMQLHQYRKNKYICSSWK